MDRTLRVDEYIALDSNRNPYFGWWKDTELWPPKPKRKPRFHQDWGRTVTTTLQKLSTDKFFGTRDENLWVAYMTSLMHYETGNPQAMEYHLDWVQSGRKR